MVKIADTINVTSITVLYSYMEDFCVARDNKMDDNDISVIRKWYKKC